MVTMKGLVPLNLGIQALSVMGSNPESYLQGVESAMDTRRGVRVYV